METLKIILIIVGVMIFSGLTLSYVYESNEQKIKDQQIKMLKNTVPAESINNLENIRNE